MTTVHEFSQAHTDKWVLKARAACEAGRPMVVTVQEMRDLKKMRSATYDLPYWDERTGLFAGAKVKVRLTADQKEAARKKKRR